MEYTIRSLRSGKRAFMSSLTPTYGTCALMHKSIKSSIDSVELLACARELSGFTFNEYAYAFTRSTCYYVANAAGGAVCLAAQVLDFSTHSATRARVLVVRCLAYTAAPTAAAATM